MQKIVRICEKSLYWWGYKFVIYTKPAVDSYNGQTQPLSDDITRLLVWLLCLKSISAVVLRPKTILRKLNAAPLVSLFQKTLKICCANLACLTELKFITNCSEQTAPDYKSHQQTCSPCCNACFRQTRFFTVAADDHFKYATHNFLLRKLLQFGQMRIIFFTKIVERFAWRACCKAQHGLKYKFSYEDLIEQQQHCFKAQNKIENPTSTVSVKQILRQNIYTYFPPTSEQFWARGHQHPQTDLLSLPSKQMHLTLNLSENRWSNYIL